MLWPAKGKSKKWLMFLCVVVIPMLVIGYYLKFQAKDRFVSASSVVIKQIGAPESASFSGLGTLLGSGSTSAEDARFLQAYILSADILKKLDARFKLRQHYQGDGGDPVFQLDEGASDEKFLAYYRSRVTAELDDQTGLLHIEVQAFDREFALMVSRAILAESEAFINSISHKLAGQQVEQSQQVLQSASERLARDRQAVLNYQNSNRSFDPVSDAQNVSRLVASLQTDLAGLQTQMRTLLAYLNPDAPQVVALRSQIQAVEQQINHEQSNLVTSQSGRRLNEKTAEIEVLTASQQLSTDLYKVALTGLEKARIEAARNLKSVITITAPQLPDVAVYPQRRYILLSCLLTLILLYSFFKLVLAVIREHRD